MIKFKQKSFSEYDAMRSLYVELMKRPDRYNYSIINTNSLIPILKGNNVVIERFVINSTFFGNDTYRMYLKIGAKVKMPDKFKLPEFTYDKRVADLSVNFNGAIFNKSKDNEKDFSNISGFNERLFAKKGGGGGPKPLISTELKPKFDITHTEKSSLGTLVKYDKLSRTIILEHKSIQDAINALNILPFGLSYKVYLLGS